MDPHMFFKIRDSYIRNQTCFILFVYLPEFSPHDQVLKIIDRSKGSYCDRELSITKIAANHNNFLECYSFQEDSKNCYIFMERCFKDTLKHYIASSKMLLTDIQLLYSMKSISKCLKILHEKKIMHRDIKPENILITNDGSLKLSDFSISKKYTNGFDTTQIGTTEYMSPEQKSGRALDSFKNDIWGFGVTFYLLAIRKNAQNLNCSQKHQIDSKIEEIKFCHEIKDILKKCLEVDPIQRIDSIQLYNNIKEVVSNLYKNNVKCVDDYYHMIKLNFQDRCMQPNYEKNAIKKMKVHKTCVLCKKGHGNINYRYFHSVHINCILKEISSIEMGTSECYICKMVYRETKEPLEEISNSNLKLFRTKDCSKEIGEEKSSRECYHVMLILTKNFASKIFTCSKSKIIFCSLCSQKGYHMHCVGPRLFLENFDRSRSSMLASSIRSEIYLLYYNIYSKWKNSDSKKLQRPQSCYVLKKTTKELNTNWLNYHHIACQGNNNVLKLHYWFFKGKETYIYYEYAEGKTLAKELLYRESRENKFNKDEIIKIARTLFECLNYLHSINIYHQNIDLNCIFIKNSEYKLGKFDRCCYLEKGFEEKAAADFNMAANAIERIWNHSIRPVDIYNYICLFREYSSRDKLELILSNL